MNKIAFVIISEGWGGLEMNTIKLAQQLQQLNFEILFIAKKNTKIYTEAKGIFDNVICLEKPKKYFDFKTAGTLSKILKAAHIQNVFLTNNRDIDLLSVTKRFYKKNLSIIFQQNMQIGINKKDILHTLRYRTLKYWISPLQVLKKEVLEKTKIPEKKIHVIPFGIDVNNFTMPMYSKMEALQKLHIPPSPEPLVGIIGRIDRKKGQLFLIKAIKGLRNKEIKLQLLIFGSPTIGEDDSNSYFTEMKDFVKRYEMQHYIHFRDYNREVKIFYDAIDIFSLASESETFGMVTIEAMASALPVIATRSGGTPEILNDEQFGLLYEYENMAEFCTKIQWILSHPKEAGNMAMRARQEVIKHYDEKKIAVQISKLILEP